jgi:hypothetical protein
VGEPPRHSHRRGPCRSLLARPPMDHRSHGGRGGPTTRSRAMHAHLILRPQRGATAAPLHTTSCACDPHDTATSAQPPPPPATTGAGRGQGQRGSSHVLLIHLGRGLGNQAKCSFVAHHSNGATLPTGCIALPRGGRQVGARHVGDRDGAAELVALVVFEAVRGRAGRVWSCGPGGGCSENCAWARGLGFAPPPPPPPPSAPPFKSWPIPSAPPSLSYAWARGLGVVM